MAMAAVGAPAAWAAPADEAAPADSTEITPPTRPTPAGDESLLVRFEPGTGERTAERAVDRAGGDVEGPAGATGYTVVSTDGRSLEEVRRDLEASGVVAEVEPNRVRHVDAQPDDPKYRESQAPYLQAVSLPAAWDRTTGSDGLVLAVLDSGVDFNHPDLAGRLLPGWDFVRGDAVPDDEHGHGTMVAGVAAARTNNERGVAGVAWKGWILPVKVLDAGGSATDANIAAGITWAVDHGADVINISLGGPGASSVLQAAVDYATARDAVVVAAAGNDGNSVPHYPAAARGVIAVGATDSGGRLAYFSNFGDWVDVVAPGVSVMTTVKGPGEQYDRKSGTSFSSPLVAGVILLMRSADPGVTQATVVDRLRRSALDLGLPGFDSFFGSGLVNASAALRLTPALNTGGTPGPGAGYWMLSTAGRIYAFGDAPGVGDPAGTLGASAADIEPNRSSTGYWIVDETGNVYAYNSPYFGGVPTGWLRPGETVTSLSATSSGNGYWIFTTAGRVVPRGDAVSFGDMAATRLNGPVLDSIPTPSGQGYYMVAADGGIFAFGDARFAGSMGGQPLNAQVQSLVPDPDGTGYWLVASDGGIFAFDAAFRGSMGWTRLNAPVTGMVAFGNGYLMVATDGGIFNFSDQPFAGSLGDTALPAPIVAVAAKR
jgi:subtilisin family serine protease